MELLLRIAEFNAAYANTIDNDRLEAWPDHFVADCHYRVTTDENFREGLPAGAMFANSRAMLIDRVSALRRANIYERQRYRHILGLPVLERPAKPEPASAEATARIRCETAFVVVRIVAQSDTSVFASGAYHDEFESGPSGLLLRSRVVVCDSSVFDTLLALPL